MKVKCIASTGEGLSRESIEAGDSRETDFQIKLGDIYGVYGINMWQRTINYLTLDKWRTVPFWTPAELFEIVDYRLPPDWYYKFYGYRQDIWLNAVWGYKELALRAEHYHGLIEREPEDLRIFSERKKEIDEFSNKST